MTKIAVFQCGQGFHLCLLHADLSTTKYRSLLMITWVFSLQLLSIEECQKVAKNIPLGEWENSLKGWAKHHLMAKCTTSVFYMGSQLQMLCRSPNKVHSWLYQCNLKSYLVYIWASGLDVTFSMKVHKAWTVSYTVTTVISRVLYLEGCLLATDFTQPFPTRTQTMMG